MRSPREYRVDIAGFWYLMSRAYRQTAGFGNSGVSLRDPAHLAAVQGMLALQREQIAGYRMRFVP